MNWQEQGTNYLKSFFQYLEGIDIKIMGSGVKLPERAKSHWKILLEKIVEDLTIAINKDQQKIVFLWDELPFMIDKIRKNEGEKFLTY